MVANARVVAIKELQKFRHRGYFIISIIDEYTNSGLGKIILNEVNVSFEKGKFYTILGASGSGKTTFLSLIASTVS